MLMPVEIGTVAATLPAESAAPRPQPARETVRAVDASGQAKLQDRPDDPDFRPAGEVVQVVRDSAKMFSTLMSEAQAKQKGPATAPQGNLGHAVDVVA